MKSLHPFQVYAIFSQEAGSSPDEPIVIESTMPFITEDSSEGFVNSPEFSVIGNGPNVFYSFTPPEVLQLHYILISIE